MWGIKGGRFEPNQLYTKVTPGARPYKWAENKEMGHPLGDPRIDFF